MTDLTDLLTIPKVDAFLKSRAEWEARQKARTVPQFQGDLLAILGDERLAGEYTAYLEQERQQIYTGYLAQLRGE